MLSVTISAKTHICATSLECSCLWMQVDLLVLAAGIMRPDELATLQLDHVREQVRYYHAP